MDKRTRDALEKQSRADVMHQLGKANDIIISILGEEAKIVGKAGEGVMAEIIAMLRKIGIRRIS